MNSRKSALERFSLPLLTKELIEQSRRPRTYVTRTVFAVLFFGSAYFNFRDVLDRVTQTNFQLMGIGRSIFESLNYWQFVGIYVFMPAMTCGSLIQERDNGTLDLLCITKLSIYTILFEKLFSRMVIMGTFIVLSMPLAGFAYSLGGIDQVQLWSRIWFMTITTFQIGCISLMCAAMYRTTVTALFLSYLMSLVLPLCCVGAGFIGFGFPLGRTTSGIAFGVVHFACVSVLCAYCLNRAKKSISDYVFGNRVNPNPYTTRISDNQVIDWQRWKVTPSRPLPEEAPIRWKERCQFHHLAGNGYLLSCYWFFVAVTAMRGLFAFEETTRIGYMSRLTLILWFLMVPFACTGSAKLFTSEKAQQTLSVLLSLPISTSDLMRQKLFGIHRGLLFVAIPYFTAILAETVIRLQNDAAWSAVGFALLSIATFIVYTNAVLWISVFVGLVARSQVAVTVTSLVVGLSVFYGPRVFHSWFAPRDFHFQWNAISYCSPNNVIVNIARNRISEFSNVEWLGISGSLAVCGLIAIACRFWCVSRGDRMLARMT